MDGRRCHARDRAAARRHPAPAPAATGPRRRATQRAAATASPARPDRPAPPAAIPAAEDWSSRVWYEAFVRSFADGDGDGIGDFAGLTAKLDYLNDGDPATTDDLGVTGMWLMPIAESPSYHGYDVVDYDAVERDYGTREDFDAFLAAAHARGIKVIVDLVLNHTSIDHPWFRDSAAGGSAHATGTSGPTTNPRYRRPGRPEAWHELDGRWYYGVFWEGMPDLNLRSAGGDRRAGPDRPVLARGRRGRRLPARRREAPDRGRQGRPDEHARDQGVARGLHGPAATRYAPDAVVVGEVWDPATIAASVRARRART